MPAPKIGILALQGAFAKHAEMIQSLGATTILVRKPEQLLECEGLIIPGGESTTIFRQMKFIDLAEAITNFAQHKPIFGTCAGLILMSKEIIAEPFLHPFGLLEVSVERNAYGRQSESFLTTIDVTLPHKVHKNIPALFIRAPRIKSVSSNVKVLATYHEEPVLVQQGCHLGATFHIELTDCTDLHSYFLDVVKHHKHL